MKPFAFIKPHGFCVFTKEYVDNNKSSVIQVLTFLGLNENEKKKKKKNTVKP